MLSGYGLTVSWEKWGHKAWWRKRLLSTFLPYFIIQVIAYWPFHEFTVQGFFLDITMIAPRYINGWYLTYLLMWYVAFYIVMRIPIRQSFRICIFAILSVASFIAFAKSVPLRAEQSASFLIGVIFAGLSQDRIKMIFKLRYGLIAIVVGVSFLGIKQLPFIRNSGEYLYGSVELMIKAPCALGLMIIGYHILKHVRLKALYGVGVISYELYLVHGYVLENVPVTWWGILLFVVLTAAVSFLMWLLLNKTSKYQKKLLRI